MTCSKCGGSVVWRGPLTALTYTECLLCGGVNCHVAEDEIPEEGDLDVVDLAVMVAFGASDAACVKYPEDTEAHRLARAAYCDAAAITSVDFMEEITALQNALRPFAEAKTQYAETSGVRHWQCFVSAAHLDAARRLLGM